MPVFRLKGRLHARHLTRAATSSVRPASIDDISLASVFDRTVPTRLDSTGSTGLFRHPLLRNATQFNELTKLTLSRADRLVNRVLRARSSRAEMLKLVKNIDRLSDMLCSVIDLAGLVRNVHPDPAWVSSANHAYETLCEYMNVLNTHVGLYQILKDVLRDQTIVRTLSPEAYRTALVFWRDFEKSGIDLPPTERKRFVSLSSEIIALGRTFLNSASSDRPPALLENQDILGKQNRNLYRLKLKSVKEPLSVRPGSSEAHLIMSSPSEEIARRQLYVASNSSTESQIDVLERLLRVRAELARLVGRESFAHMTLEDKMAKTPENVREFLETKISYIQPQVFEAIRSMAIRKQEQLGLLEIPTVHAWDEVAFTPPKTQSHTFHHTALTAGNVFLGLSRLFTNLFGVSLRLAETSLGEIWHEDVRKLEVVDENDGVIGWLYIDLFHRENKEGGAVHYTVVCSRRTDDDDEQGDVSPEEALDGTSMPALRDSLPFNRYTIRGRQGTYQLPVAVLTFDFPRPAFGEPAWLNWNQVSTLCHEMGHAMHLMLGRTEYQNVSGLRVATDFVELPSILMEHFITSPEVLSLFVEPRSTSGSMRVPDVTHSALDDHNQLLLGLIDQIYHSTLPLDSAFDSTATFARLQNDKSPIKYVPGTSWQTQFRHLYDYGATYYSYMLDRGIARRIWETLFRSNPLSRDLGEKYKSEVLIHGGGRDPWEMLSRVLDMPELEKGDAGAMREVGRWGIENDTNF